MTRKYQDWGGIELEWDEEELERQGNVTLTKSTFPNGRVGFSVDIPYVYMKTTLTEDEARKVFDAVVAEQGQMVESSLRRLEDGLGY